jgi:ABC-type polysaccharide/polyol phosphate export permease
MKTAMPTEMEIAEHMKAVFLGIKRDGEQVIAQFFMANPLLHIMAAVRLALLQAGPEEHYEVFLNGLKKILDNDAQSA